MYPSLFQAKTNQPSVIFFDELDALAPARSCQQDHIYTTIVGTLLTLLDGLEDRQQVGPPLNRCREGRPADADGRTRGPITGRATTEPLPGGAPR